MDGEAGAPGAGTVLTGGQTAGQVSATAAPIPPPAAPPPQAPPPAAPPADAPPPPPWYSSFSDDLKGNTKLHQFKGPEDLARAYFNSEAMLGKDPTRVVELPDTPESQRALFQRLGLPEKAEEYKLEDVADAQEFGKANSEMAQWLREQAHDIGIIPSQMQELFSRYGMKLAGAQQEIAKTNGETSEANKATLKQVFGQAHDQKIAAANVAANHFGLTDKLNQLGLGTEPSVIKALAALGETLKEGAGGPPGGKGSSKMTPDAARAKANDLMAQAVKATDKHEKQRFADEAQKFYRMAHGE